jgi:hypothetical protein
VLALQGWLESAGIVEGPIWRRVSRWDTVGPERQTAQSVDLIIKRACRRAGINPERYAGHSLRAGLSTAAGEAKAAGGGRSCCTAIAHTRARPRRALPLLLARLSGRL